ncbi:MAG: aldehyde dehydrogenase family protein, partial [Nanoarchaeota archaeon]
LKKRPLGTVIVTLPPNACYTMLNNVFTDMFLAGIPMIIKAPRKSAVVPYELANLYLKKIKEFGLPKAICMVTGDSKEIIEKLITNENITGLIFIGGDNTGNNIIQRYSNLKKPIVLEMNGSNIVIYLGDINKEDFINDINFSIKDRIFGASGQFCLSPKRLLIPDMFRELTLQIANKICNEAKPGLMSAENTNLVPVSDIETVIKQLKDYSNESNVEIIRLGKRVDIKGNEDEKGEFLSPSIILVKYPLNSSIFMREEILGPIIQIGICDDLNKAIEIVNKSRYNIRVSFHTKEHSSISSIMAKCRSGGIFFNLPHLRGWGGIAVGGMGDSCESDVGPRFFYDNFLDKHYEFYVTKLKTINNKMPRKNIPALKPSSSTELPQPTSIYGTFSFLR